MFIEICKEIVMCLVFLFVILIRVFIESLSLMMYELTYRFSSLFVGVERLDRGLSYGLVSVHL